MENQFIINDAGWLVPAQHLPSPNFSERPPDSLVRLLVIHNISLPPGQFNGHAVEDFFLNRLDYTQDAFFEQLKDLMVSSHLFIRRDGAVIQFVPFSKKAWHAGVSSFNGATQCNDFSIGIELEGTDTQAFTQHQYEVLIAITKLIMHTYPLICLDHIVGHSDIAPGRKTDPGLFFDWKKFKSYLK